MLNINHAVPPLYHIIFSHSCSLKIYDKNKIDFAIDADYIFNNNNDSDNFMKCN